MQRKLVIWGGAGHAKVVADILRLTGEFEIVGFIDDVNPRRIGSEFCGFPILGGREEFEKLKNVGVTHVIFGFGDCNARLRLADVVRASGFELATAIHPSATVARDVQIGVGTVIAAAVVLCPGASVGQNVIINTCASVDHDCEIGNAVHLSPGVHVGGHVTVGQGTWVGIGATIRDHIRIGSGSMIGAGAVVVKDVPDQVVSFGVPSRVIRRLPANGANSTTSSLPSP